MNLQVKVFKSIAAQACRSQSFPFSGFMDDRGLQDLLIEANDKNLSATEIAGLVLWECCCTDGKFNNFQAGFLAVLLYLKDQKNAIGTQPFLDLGAMIRRPRKRSTNGWKRIFRDRTQATNQLSSSAARLFQRIQPNPKLRAGVSSLA